MRWGATRTDESAGAGRAYPLHLSGRNQIKSLIDPGALRVAYRFIAQIADSAIEICCAADEGRDIFRRRNIKVWSSI